jgi:NADPH-dependent glutamate synthase beta subunit-like oxidoreductase
MGKWTPAIPALRAVTDKVEGEVSPYRRYQAHTAPKYEKDVGKWMQRLIHDKALKRDPSGRSLSKESTPKDVASIGSHPAKMKKSVQDWAKRRDTEYLTEQTYDFTGTAMDQTP